MWRPQLTASRPRPAACAGASDARRPGSITRAVADDWHPWSVHERQVVDDGIWSPDDRVTVRWITADGIPDYTAEPVQPNQAIHLMFALEDHGAIDIHWKRLRLGQPGHPGQPGTADDDEGD
jgi:hypothetical protein